MTNLPYIIGYTMIFMLCCRRFANKLANREKEIGNG